MTAKPDFALLERNLEIWADSNWSVEFSTSGTLFYFYGCLFAWFSRRQHCVAHSTAEAEYVGASMAARDGSFHRDVLHDLGYLAPMPTPLYLDSKSAIDMAFDPVAFKKTKHILRDAYYLRDLVARQFFAPSHVASSEELADILTKALPRALFLRLRAHLVAEI